MRTHIFVLCLAGTILALIGCGSSDSSAPPPIGDPKALAGTWGGTFDDGSTLYAFAVTVTAAGTVSTFTVPGTSSQLSGTIAGVSGYPTFFAVTFSDGSEGGFMTDSTLTHLYFLSDGMDRASLQKGNSGAFGSYTTGDFTGTWSGTFAEVDSAFNLTTSGTASASINSNGTFSGSNSAGGTFSGALSGMDASAVAGWAFGTFTSSTGSGGLEALMTRDKQFIGSLACDGGIAALDNCTYNMWVKQ